MKRIIAAVAVVVIVSSALAFKAKPLAGSFCGNPIGTNGCQILPQLREAGGPNNYHVKANWNGTAADCTTSCATLIHLDPQN